MAVCQTIAALELPIPVGQLVCCVCESQKIPAPPGANLATRYLCRWCSARIWRRKQTARAKLPVDPEVVGGSRIPF